MIFSQGEYVMNSMKVDLTTVVKYTPFIAGRLVLNIRFVRFEKGSKKLVSCFKITCKMYNAAKSRTRNG